MAGEPEIVASEVQPVAAPEATQAPEVTATPEAAEGQPEAQPERTFTQKELDEIVQKRLGKERRTAERIATERVRREAAEREVERLQAERNPPTTSPTGEPKPEQFKDYESYVRAVTRWEIQQSFKGVETQAKTQREEMSRAEQARAVRERFVAPGAEKYDDFEEVALADDLPITGPMLDAMADTAISHDIAYYLGTHRDEAKRIAGLTNAQQVREIDKIAATLTAPKQPTKAPQPIVPNASKGTVKKDISEMSYSEFVAERKRQIANRYK